jgi:hypothetical protein
VVCSGEVPAPTGQGAGSAQDVRPYPALGAQATSVLLNSPCRPTCLASTSPDNFFVVLASCQV